VFDESYDDVCLSEWAIGVCYATTFKIGEETVAVVLAVPQKNSDEVHVTFHCTPRGQYLRDALEALSKSIAIAAQRALWAYQEGGSDAW
tara:strand:+ start:1701 stop:1967 length:267 start_codon:yes stop_codon:yes gene_type:complete